MLRPLVSSLFCLAGFSGLAALSGRAMAEPGAPISVGLVYTGPGCFDVGNTNINMVAVLFDHFRDAGSGRGAVYVASTGTGALSRGDRVLLPPESASDALSVGAFLAGLGSQPPQRELIEADLPVLDSPYELLFQYPSKGHFDWLGLVEAQTQPNEQFPDVRRRRADLVRYTDAAGHAVLGLELVPLAGGATSGPPADSNPLAGPVESWVRQFTALTHVDAPDDHVKLWSIGKRLRTGARVVTELSGLRKPTDLFLHPGGVSPRGASTQTLAACGQNLASQKPTAIVPRESDLALGVAGLTAFAATHALPFIAANLVSTADDKAPFPRFQIVEREGLTIAIIGLVDRDELSRLPAAARSQWRVERPTLALARVRQEMETQLRRRPDLTIALVSTEGESVGRLLGTLGTDVALGVFNRHDLLSFSEVVSVGPERGGREGTRNQPLLLNVSASDTAVGRIQVDFETGAGAPASLRRLAHESRPVLAEGPADAAMDLAARQLEERDVPRSAQILLPDVALFLPKRPDLAPLVWGRHVLHQSGYRDYAANYPARFSDLLWMRLVTNLLREQLGAEVALSRNLPRGFDTVGPLTRDVFENWVSAPDAVRVVRVRGEALMRLGERLLRQRDDAQVPATAYVVASGYDPERQVVSGRPVDPAEIYRVAVTDAVLDMADLQPILTQFSVSEHFVTTSEGFEDRADGQELRISQVMERGLGAWSNPGTGHFDPAYQAAFEQSLTDPSPVLTARWMLRLDEVSLSLARYRNTENVDTFAASRETRATTPNNLSLAAGLNTALIYDGPAIAWETRLKGTLQRVVLDIPGEDIPPQEQADDVLGSTELRLNAVRLELGDGRVPLVPFLQALVDTELTATPNPTEEDADATYPHQLLLRGALGVVSYPGPRLQEVRLGGLVQRDLSEDVPHDDFGFLAGLRFELPLVGPLLWSSLADLRYTVPDSDDRETDLGLVLSTTQKLMVGVAGGFSVFGMLDAYLVRGKTDSNRALGGSYILGGGLQFSELFKL